MRRDSRPPYHRRQTKPLPRAELAPISTRSDREEAETMARCPACAGVGMVTATRAQELKELIEPKPHVPTIPIGVDDDG